jgi:glutaminase
MGTVTDLTPILVQIAEEMGDWPESGKSADYIPELARIDPDQFAIAVVTADGATHSAGLSDKAFTIQSVSKVFALALSLGHVGNTLWQRVGVEPSGQRFDSILQLEQERGRPRNPFINAGAIVVTDTLLDGCVPREALGGMLRFVQEAAEDDSILMDPAVAQSEIATGARNFALAHYMKSHGNLIHAPELVLGTYFHQCAIEMNVVQLARAGRFLASLPGVAQLVSPERVRRINALMVTCGHYDGSGDFAFRVGLPGKSGVGGGILAIAPGRASIAVWSPGLNSYGNSLRGTLALERLTSLTGWSVFG